MAKGKIEVNAELCKGCDFCITFCPKEIIQIGQKQNLSGFFYAVQVDPNKKCNACKICGIICPEAAIEVLKICDCASCDCEEKGSPSSPNGEFGVPKEAENV